MKQLFALTVALAIFGFAGFMYRNALEHPNEPMPIACTMEARLCPDGTSVGRSGPSCEFSACAFPNTEDKTIGIAFAVPSGYVSNPEAIGSDESLRAVFDKTSNGSVPHSIIVRRFFIPEGKSGEEVVVANTMLEPSGNTAKSIKEFKPVILNGKTYHTIVLERFEGQVHSAYYLVRASDVLKFEVLEKEVSSWTDPALVVSNLPEHRALQTLLATLQTP